MQEPTQTQVVRALIVQHSDGMHPVIRRIILEHFLKARQQTIERPVETVQHPHINVTTYLSFNSEGMMICEDVVVEARKAGVYA